MSFVNTKTLVLIGIIVVLLLLIKNIAASILTLRQNSHIVTTLQQQEKAEQQKKEFLKQQLYLSNTQEFVEGQAREKLGMVKPGEHIILAPPEKIEEKKIIAVDNTPNWKKWWNLFF